jgi:hypothetical protein
MKHTFIVINHRPFDLVGVTFQYPHAELIVLLVMCWQTLWVRMRGKKMSYSALTRCSTKMRSSLMSTTSLQCPLFQVWAFLFPCWFILPDSPLLFSCLYSGLFDSHFIFSGNRCHQRNKWDYNYLWSGMYCFVHLFGDFLVCSKHSSFVPSLWLWCAYCTYLNDWFVIILMFYFIV